MKISYVSSSDNQNINAWSGLVYNIGKSLENQNAEVEYISKLETKLSLSIKLKLKIYKTIGKGYDFNRNASVAKHWAQQIERRISNNTNVIFGHSSMTGAMLNTDVPTVFYTDATFAGLIDFYDDFKNLSKETIKDGNFLEQKALDNCTLAIYSSDWAAATALKYYSADPSKIKVVPFGANVECNRNFDDIKEIVKSRSKDCCNLLFLGVDWRRKGLEKAIKVTTKLNEIGRKTFLHIAGPKTIEGITLPSFVINHGFLNKEINEDQNKINQLLAYSHFLILPTKADCTPVVYSEANSFGLPCISTNVGGIPTIITNNVNGMMFELTDSADVYADYITDMFADFERYKSLCFSTFGEYTMKLNWNVAGKSLMRLLTEI